MLQFLSTVPQHDKRNQKSFAIPPPSFGHRPGSGSRMFHPSNVIHNHLSKKASVSKCGMRLNLLKHLLNQKPSGSHEKKEHSKSPTSESRNTELGSLDLSLYDIWTDANVSVH